MRILEYYSLFILELFQHLNLFNNNYSLKILYTKFNYLLNMDADIFKEMFPQEYIKKFLSKGIRNDGR